jgi:methyl-accepting chemotaxis protein
MKKIKIVGAFIFLLTVVLLLLFGFISNEHKEKGYRLTVINEQKAFTQEISKSIFYSYQNGNKHLNVLDSTIKRYLENAKTEKSAFDENRQILTLWNIFYADVQKFRNQQKVSTGYNAVITAKLVNRIYHNNVLLINEFDKLIQLKEKEGQGLIEIYREIQYVLFTLLIILLIYMFTQIHVVIEFIQKFRKTSKNIIENSTIQGLKPIEELQQEELKEASQNYNHLVEQINRSIDYSSQSIEQTTSSLEQVAENIENFMSLLSTMNRDESEKLFDQEDAVIDSLEVLMRLRKKLKYLQKDLDNLSSSSL